MTHDKIQVTVLDYFKFTMTQIQPLKRKTTVFYVSLQAYHNDLIKHLAKPEQLRANTFTNQTRQQLFILGRVLLAEALHLLTGERHFELRYQKQGKPEFHPTNDWQFNLTHSGKHLFLAMRPSHPIGIDSEIMLPRKYDRLAKKLFTIKEQQHIARAEDPMQVFYRYWTCYEAQIKYLGLSVFSELPEAPKRFLASYHYQSLIFSLCSDSPIKNIDSYCYHPNKKSPFENMVLKQLG